MRTEQGAKYRWLAVGDRVRYVGRGGRPMLRGETGCVLMVPDYSGDAPKNIVVRFDDAELRGLIAPAGCWRKVSA